jgi:hypothetical protein
MTLKNQVGITSDKEKMEKNHICFLYEIAEGVPPNKVRIGCNGHILTAHRNSPVIPKKDKQPTIVQVLRRQEITAALQKIEEEKLHELVCI